MEGISDEVLMNEVKEGRIAAFGELFERYHHQLYNFFLKMTRDREGSEDLVQTTFTRMLAYRRSFQPDRSFRTWMYKVARNAHIDEYNSKRFLVDEYTDSAATRDNALAAIEHMQKEERIEALKEAMALLPVDQREILVLQRFEGMKYEEISKITGSSPVAARVKAHRALNRLRELYFQTV